MQLQALLTSILLASGLATCSQAQNTTASPSVRWHIPLLGPAAQSFDAKQPLHRFSHVVPPHSHTKRSLLFTVSEQGVLAALEPRNGTIGACSFSELAQHTILIVEFFSPHSVWRRWLGSSPIQHSSCGPSGRALRQHSIVSSMNANDIASQFSLSAAATVSCRSIRTLDERCGRTTL